MPEEAHAQLRFQLFHGLRDRCRCDIELGGGAPEVQVARDAVEGEQRGQMNGLSFMNHGFMVHQRF